MAHAYTQVYTDLLQKIRNGTYAVGTLLPPEPELEKIYGVSRTTVRRAISLLATSQLIRVKQGHGTEVLSTQSPKRGEYFRFHGVTKISEELSGERRTIASPLCIDTVPATEKIAEFLHLRAGAPVYRLQRISKFDDGDILSYKINYLSPKTFPKLDRFNNMSVSLYALLYDKYNVLFDHGTETISAVAADFMDSQVFGVEVGSPLMLLTRYAYSVSEPLEYCELKIIPKHYTFRVHMEGSPYPYDK